MCVHGISQDVYSILVMLDPFVVGVEGFYSFAAVWDVVYRDFR